MKGGPAKMQSLQPLGDQVLDGRPHDQIVPAKLLKGAVGGTKLVKRLGSEMEENGGSNGTLSTPGGNDEAGI